jgi:hypothetical protein
MSSRTRTEDESDRSEDVISRMWIKPFSYCDERGVTRRVCRTARLKWLLWILAGRSVNGRPVDVMEADLALLMCCSKRTIDRAVAACEALGLVSVKRRFGDLPSRFQIDWAKIKTFDRSRVVADAERTDATGRKRQTKGHANAVITRR